MAQSSAPETLHLRSLLRPHAKKLAVALACVVAGGAASLLQPWPMKLLFDHVGGGKAGRGIGSRVLPAGMNPHGVLLVVAISAVAIAVVNALCSYAQKWATTSVGQRVTHELRTRLYAHVQSLSMDYHTSRKTGDLIARLTSDVDAVQSFAVSSLLDGVVDCLTLVGMFTVMFFLNWRFTIIALSVAPVLFAVTYYYTRRSKRASRELRRNEGEIVSLLQEVLSAIAVVKAFGQEERESRRLEARSAQTVEIALRARSTKAMLSPLAEVVAAIGTALMLWYGGDLVVTGRLSAGSLVVLVWYLGKMYKPMQDFARLTDSYAKAAVSYERLREVFDTQPTVGDLPAGRSAKDIRGDIEFQNVNFSYIPGRPTLRDLNFLVPAGQMTALVGPNGSGKSTIAALVGRFYDPDSGAVKLDGVDLRQYCLHGLQEQISFVLQDSVLFNASIRENIAYGKPDATPEEIQRATNLANVDEFVSKLPDGLDTFVGERGVMLSGGQRQRIAIARAIVRESPILILDEPSSGLDAVSEALVFEAIERLIEGKSALVIAHRFSTVRRAALILVVEEGRIVEQGTHDQLLQRGGLYTQLFDLQLRAQGPTSRTDESRESREYRENFGHSPHSMSGIA
jgi:ATP-binding cassette, subfamily B, bacterial